MVGRGTAGACFVTVALLGVVVAVRAPGGPVGQSAAGYQPGTDYLTAPATTWAPPGASSSSRAPSALASSGQASSAAALAASAPAQPTSGWIATLSGPTTWSATPGGLPVASLAATNPYGGPQTVAVVGAPGTGEWLHVELPVRPNGSTGWIRADAAHLTWTPYSIQVSLAARTLTLWKGTQVLLRSAAAIGASSTPTPTDHTYVWELVQPGDPTGDYGPYIFGLAEYSDAYSVFNGGDAQIGIHGTDEPSSIGLAASHGCVRLPNSTVSGLVGILPLGTPVTIS